MKKLIKLAGILIAVVVTLLVAVVVLVTTVIDPNDYKDDITRAVSESTGHALLIEGDLALSFFPWVGIEVGKTQLAGAPGYGDTPMAKIEQVNIKVKLLPLLSKKVEMDTVVLDGVALHMVKDASGKGNWEVAAPEKKGKQSEASQKQKSDADEDRNELAGVAINGVEVRNASLVWDDRASNKHITLADVKLTTGHLQPGTPVALEMELDVKDRAAAKSFHVALSSRVLLDPEQQTLTLDELKLTLAELVLKGQVKVTQLQKSPVVQGELASNEFVPRDLASVFGVVLPATRDPAVFGKASLQLALSSKEDAAEISKLRLRLDDTTLEGKVGVSNFAKPAIRFSLALDEIDADRYLPPAPPADAPAAQKATVSTTAGGAAEAELLPVELLRDLDVSGDMKIGKLKAFNLRSQQVVVGLNARQGKLRVHPASANLYEGGYKGDINIDVSGRTPRISMNEKLTGVQAEPLFLDVANMKWVTGKADMSARLTTTGNTMSVLRKGLNGEVEFSFLNGAIKGFNLMHTIRSANAMIQGFPAPAAEAQQTDFAELRGHANVRDGVVHNDLLVATSPLFKVSGKGSADLVREQLDYRVTTEITASLEGEAGKRLEKIKGTPLPVKISGSFYDPSIQVDLEDILKEKLKKKVEEKVEQKIQEKLDDKLKDKLGDKLKGLFNR